MNESEETYSTDSDGYSPEQVSHLLDQVRNLRNAQPAVQLDLSHLSEQLTVPRARIFANEALGRRLPVIERAVLNIFDIYPPSRRKFLTKDECTDIAIQLHAFAINVYAVLDNAAWICMLQAGKTLAPANVGLFKKECQAFLPPALLSYISQPTIKKWFNEYGKVYRDSTAHRIPPYLPDRIYTPAEGIRWQELHKESMALLLDLKPGQSLPQINERLAKHEQLEAEKQQLGRNSLMVGLTLTGEDAKRPVFLHPQLLSDWGLVHEFVKIVTQAIRQQYEWQAPVIPL